MVIQRLRIPVREKDSDRRPLPVPVKVSGNDRLKTMRLRGRVISTSVPPEQINDDARRCSAEVNVSAGVRHYDISFLAIHRVVPMTLMTSS